VRNAEATSYDFAKSAILAGMIGTTLNRNYGSNSRILIKVYRN